MAKQDMMMKMVMKSQPKSPEIVPLTAVKITEWNPALEKIFSDMEECDPMLDRSLIFKRLTSCAFAPYAETFQAKAKRSRANVISGVIWEKIAHSINKC